ncbi:MAG: hypothetical protein H6920_10700 [Sphingomonadaceae bacterium]|nr:hypothetical protein [Sphingomonadaceae bacterium]MCP5392074.1 hypothetical protein [Sphingomonadaceae bacterium]MCP5394762.1 hypothetical protein [Sphingomonadaceae bacterium]
MTRGTGQGATTEVATSDESWDAVHGNDAIQFSPIKKTPIPEQVPPEPREPGWLERFFEWLGDLLSPIGKLFGASWPVVQWIMIGLAVAMLLYLLYRLLEPVLEFRIKKDAEVEEEWVPEREEALALLDDADRLAQEGRYDEATHLLLKRSVGQISAARPEWVEPSSTARELAALPALPEAARNTFSVIAERVERSLFALRPLVLEDWEAARAAYAEFALQKLTGRHVQEQAA